ncbi:glycosyltransferase, partial [bacterium]|nr:glycosyltransferase [bacterium]
MKKLDIDSAMPKVSVIIPAFNAEKFICDAIESVLQQTYKGYEIIVVDDGSTDNTASLLNNYGKAIKYIRQENKGLAIARNVAIQNSQGEYIALLDADDLFSPNRLARGVDVLDHEPEIGLTHADAVRISEQGELLGVFERDTTYLDGYISDELLLRKSLLICPTIMFRKECLVKAGMFDENLTRLGVEDRDLWIRIAQHYKVKYIPEVLAYYRNSVGSMSKDHEKMLEARLYVINKYCPESAGLQIKRRRVLSATFRKMGDW